MLESANHSRPTNEADERAVYQTFNSIARPQSASAIDAIRLFADYCLMPGADFEEPIQVGPGLSEDTVTVMAAYLRAFYANVARRDGPQHDQWPQFTQFAHVCTARVIKDLPPTDGRVILFQRNVGHSPTELMNLYYGDR